jgi:hypothetical protein
MKQEDLQKASKNIYTSTIVVSHGPVSPTSNISSAMKTTENKQGEPKPANEGDRQMEYSSD